MMKQDRMSSDAFAGNMNSDAKWYHSSSMVLTNFVVMALCFSINHGTVTAAIALATTDLGPKVGSLGLGVLYTFYTLSALTISAALVQRTGSKWGMVSGLGLYCFYVGSFLVSVIAPDLKWVAAVVGSTVGGFGAGWLWTAQGGFFSRSAKLYANAKGVDEAQATSLFSGIFATFYVGMEVVCKFGSSLLTKWGGDKLVYTVFTILAVGSAFLCGCVKPVPVDEEAAAQQQRTPLSRKFLLAMSLFARNHKMQLLLCLNIAFGFTSSYMNGYVNLLGKTSLGKDNIGYLASVTPGVATILSLPFSFLANHIGKCPMMVFGAICFLAISVIATVLSDTQIQELKWGLTVFYVLMGAGRAVFENTNKAVFADFFPNDKEAAFANVIFQSGGASALAFFVFPYISPLARGIVTAVFSFLAIFSLVGAFRLHNKEKRSDFYTGLTEEA